MIIFAVILIYVIIVVVAYFRTERIVGYEVKEGSLSSNHIYNNAIAVREEQLVYAGNSGYVNYFAAEGSRVGTGGLVYTIDSAGGLQEIMMTEGNGTIVFNASDYGELRNQIVQFTSAFHPKSFSTAYDFRNSLNGTAQKLTNQRVLASMEALNDARVESISYYSSPMSGIVVYHMDGYEDLTPENVTSDMFGDTAYDRNLFGSNALVEEGDPVYKLVTDENWCVVIQTDAETAEQLKSEEYIRVRFLKNQDESWGRVETIVNGKGEHLVALWFSNSMITFCTDRFLSIELLLQEQKGLKIPNTAVVDKSFFLVETSYVTMGEEGTEGVMKRVYSENGTESVEFVATGVYAEQDGYYYIDPAFLSAGDVLYQPDSQETCTVSAQETLTGVYNINKGYADFRRINVLYANEEYSIVESDTMYGLSVYDRIVLDASTVTEDELIYK
ncbi:MAG: hypothetical protein IJR00_00110 [Lachnospiraceae bacterium]|nr:hypothetical protein [Lachnospiraceae bacterium]